MLPYLGGFLTGDIGVRILDLIGVLRDIGALKFEKTRFGLKLVFVVPPDDSLMTSSVGMNFTLLVSACFNFFE